MRKVTGTPFDMDSFEKIVHSKSVPYSTFVDATNLDEPTIDTGLPKNIDELETYELENWSRENCIELHV